MSTSTTTSANRRKMVSFRLSDDEFDCYRDACATIGVRSISELARAALSKLVVTSPATGGSDTDTDTKSLREHVNRLSHEVARLTTRMDLMLKHGQPPAPASVAPPSGDQRPTSGITLQTEHR